MVLDVVVKIVNSEFIEQTDVRLVFVQAMLLLRYRKYVGSPFSCVIDVATAPVPVAELDKNQDAKVNLNEAQ